MSIKSNADKLQQLKDAGKLVAIESKIMAAPLIPDAPPNPPNPIPALRNPFPASLTTQPDAARQFHTLAVPQTRLYPATVQQNIHTGALAQSTATTVTQAAVGQTNPINANFGQTIQAQITQLQTQFKNMGFQGAWSATQYYPIDSQVTDAGQYWTAIVANTNEEPSLSPTFWQQLSGTEPYLGSWSSATAYVDGDQVSYLGNFFIAIAPGTNNTPAIDNSSAFWTLLGTSVILIGAWSGSTAYLQGNEVTFTDGNVYQCILANTNQTPPNATYWSLIGPATLNSVADGTTKFGQTASSLTYRPLTNPLVAGQGANTTINIASFTMRTSSKGDISIGGGSVTGLAYTTLYYVYYDDPTLAGGSVTFQATTTKETAISDGTVTGRFFVGSILTPAAGGSDNIGNNDGGAGAQAGNLATVFFSTLTTTNSNTTITTPTNCYDGDDSSYGSLSVVHPASNSGATLTVSLPMLATYSFQSATLNVKTAIPTASSGGAVLAISISYSLDSGASFTTIYSGAGATRPITIDVITLTSPINLARIQVKIAGSLTVTPTGSYEIDFYEAWLDVLT